MCLISRERKTRRIEVSDVAVIGTVNDYGGNNLNAAVPVPKQRGIVCLCLKEGDELTLTNLPADFIAAHALVGPTASVIFREGGAYRRMDKVEFDNGEVVPFNDLPLGVQLTCTARGDQPKPKTKKREVAQVVLPTLGYEPELVGTGRGGGFLASVRSNPRVGAGVGLLAFLASVAFLR